VCTWCGELADVRCRSNRCRWCGGANAMLLAAAIEFAGVDRFITLTLTRGAEEWEPCRRGVYHLQADLNQRVGESEWAWTREANPRGTGTHVHAMQRGPWKVPQRLLSERAAARGFGRVVDVRRAYPGVGSYALKEAAARYGLKGAVVDVGEHLALNGGRLVHVSRGFWGVRGQHPQRVAIARAMDARGWTVCPSRDGSGHVWSPIGGA
jgi:hypothetical protein